MSYKPWNLSELKPSDKNAPTVFSCFHCGGGSTMGYKLAGFNVLGGVEIDPEMMRVYKANHNPKYSYLMGVQDFKNIPDDELPKELFNLDVLDGSPPCSSFSTAGSREKKWGKKGYFREGQSEQVLDELFFDFIDIADKLKPKVIVAENVSGIIKGNAKSYVKRIFEAMNLAGYDVQLFLLNAAFMGVPQRRERVFFVARRKDLNFTNVKMEFNHKPILFEDIDEGNVEITDRLKLTLTAHKYWHRCEEGASFDSIHPKGSLFNWTKVDRKKPLYTLVAGNTELFFHPLFERKLTNMEWILGQSFPIDYNFLNSNPKHICGMSVPPKMMEKVAIELRKQWLNGLSKPVILRPKRCVVK